MQQVSINLYQFSELSGVAKAKALEEQQDINVAHDWWQFEFEDFRTLFATIGINVDTDKIYFKGFYSQSDSSSFNATIDFTALLKGIKNKNWKEYAPKLKLDFFISSFNSSVIKLIENDKIEFYPEIKSSSRGTTVEVEAAYDFRPKKYTYYENIDGEMAKLKAG